ncbi:calponin homology domain-containing protein DDB_G0272472-like [Ornithodoros turicata]|uniref:calponin homology domain-containing protein DDB_G0272472-like n=1 Tax=Ornithodoros turicata TaxID=34597 RepID=UPI003139536C
MDLSKLRVPDLLLLVEELGGSAGQAKRKPQIIELIRGIGADDEELTDCWQLILERKEKDEAAKQERVEKEKRDHELTVKRLELEKLRLEAESSGRVVGRSGNSEQIKIKDLLQPFKVGEDIGLYLVNFDRTCEKVGFERDVWPQKLLTLLPCEAADVIARLSKEGAAVYAKAKDALLKKYRLSTEAFRQRFRTSNKKPDESFPEHAYRLKANLLEWLKSAEVHGGHDKVIECIALEQFYRCLPEATMFWVQDRMKEVDVQKAAELAEEFAARRKAQTVSTLSSKGSLESEKESLESGKVHRKKFHSGRFGKGQETAKRNGNEARLTPATSENRGQSNRENTRVFESRRRDVCYVCNKPGHYAGSCPNKVVFSYVSSSAENAKLLEAYLRDMTVNDKPCRVLRDSAATMDVVHP